MKSDRDDAPLVLPHDYLCDVCGVGPPAWRYKVPEGFSPVAFRDTATGAVLEPMRLMGGFGLCDACRAIVDGSLHDAAAWAALPERMGARAVHVRPDLQAQPARIRTMARKVFTAIVRKVLPFLREEPKVAVRGEHPLDGRMVVLPGAAGGSDAGSGHGPERN